MDQPELTCKELVELVTEYLEGALPPPEVNRFEAHLSDCPGCTIYVEQIRQTIRVMGEISEESLNKTMRDTLLDVFRDWKSNPSDGPTAH